MRLSLHLVGRPSKHDDDMMNMFPGLLVPGGSLCPFPHTASPRRGGAMVYHFLTSHFFFHSFSVSFASLGVWDPIVVPSK